MEERSRKKEKKEKESPFGINIDFGMGNFLSGLGTLVEQLSELAEKGGEIARQGEVPLGKEFKGMYGFTVKVGGLGKEREVKFEPFGNIKKSKEGTAVVEEEREPLVDLFDEEDLVLVVAEMPGIEEKDIKLVLKGDVLEVSAQTKDKRYHKEVLLPRTFTEKDMGHTYRNGILEIRFKKKA
jgi:HSP20 family protein